MARHAARLLDRHRLLDSVSGVVSVRGDVASVLGRFLAARLPVTVWARLSRHPQLVRQAPFARIDSAAALETRPARGVVAIRRARLANRQ